MTEYVIKNLTTGKYFAGIACGSPVWADINLECDNPFSWAWVYGGVITPTRDLQDLIARGFNVEIEVIDGH